MRVKNLIKFIQKQPIQQSDFIRQSNYTSFQSYGNNDENVCSNSIFVSFWIHTGIGIVGPCYIRTWNQHDIIHDISFTTSV